MVSLGVGFLVVKDTKEITILKASILSLLLLFLTLIIVSYVFLLTLAPQIFSQVDSYEIIIIFPQVMVYFGVYVLGNIFMLFIMSIVIYYIYFLVFIEVFYEYKKETYTRVEKYRR